MLISEFIEASNSISNIENLCVLLTEATIAFGYDRFAYGGIVGYGRQNESERPASATALNYPEEWIEHYFGNNLKDLDPVVQHAPNLANPFMWEMLSGPFSLEKPQITLLYDARDAGLNNGCSVPLHGRWGQVATVSLA